MGNVRKQTAVEGNRGQSKNSANPRKKRTYELIQVGGLAEIAGLLECEPGALLGFFLQAKVMLEDEVTYKHLKIIGDKVLKDRAIRRQAKRKAKRQAR